MSYTVCLLADTLQYPEGGGHMWVYLNWALGLKSIGCKIIWLEKVKTEIPDEKLEHYVGALKSRLFSYGLQVVTGHKYPNNNYSQPSTCF